MHALRDMLLWLDAGAGGVLMIGLALVGLWNGLKWRQNRALALCVPQPEPLVLGATPRVSLLVPAWNESHMIQKHCVSFLHLRYPNRELILCAGGPDGTFELAQQYASDNVVVMEQRPKEGKQKSLARCLARATGEVIFLTDADCLLDNESFERTLAPLIDHGEVAVEGSDAPLQEQRENSFVLMQWYIRNWGRVHSPAYLEGLSGRNAVLARTVLDKIQAFSDPVSIGEDYYLACQLAAEGVSVYLARDSHIETKYETDWRTYFRQQSRWLRTIFLHGRTFGAGEQVRSALLQCLSGAAVILWLLTLPFTSWLGLALWTIVISYGTLARFRYIRFGEITLGQPRRLSVYLLAPFALVLDQVMLVYTLVEWLIPGLRESW